jgi:methylthioribose-1-phosphate isomerase
MNISNYYQPIEWLGDKVRILDQTLLPFKETYFETDDYRQVADAIITMKVRGAPAIGVTAAYGIALGALTINDISEDSCRTKLHEVIKTISLTRPTARNLYSTIERMNKLVARTHNFRLLKRKVVEEAECIHEEEKSFSLQISQKGQTFVRDGMTILTHCNTGPLATTGYGTALGIIIYAFQHGKHINVFVDETRPLLQGARLTVWELQKVGIPLTLITDSMAGFLMYKKKIDLVVVGADCITANGDSANKIGTYSLAVLAKTHNIPFIIAAPTSTIDVSRKTGKEIVIEERRPEEVTRIFLQPITLSETKAANPAFDITPSKYITAIVTERGIISKPYRQQISGLVKNK